MVSLINTISEGDLSKQFEDAASKTYLDLNKTITSALDVLNPAPEVAPTLDQGLKI